MAKRNSKPKTKSSAYDKEDVKEDYKNKKKRSRRGGKPSDSSALSDADRYANDPAWWMKQGQLAKDAATFSTFNANGAPFHGFEYGRTQFTPAGIARYDYIPFFGDINSVVDPLNVSAKLLYDMINAKNSRNSSYDPSDLMLYTVCVANAWVIHSFIQRIVGFYTTFDPMNRYWWVPILESMGVSPVSVQHDIVAWRNLANRIAVKLNMLSVPDGIAYFQRAIFMCNGIYMDAPTAKASMYYFSPAALFKWEYDSEGKGIAKLHQTPWYNTSGQLTSVTPADVESYFNSLTENLFNDSDIVSMGADIIKAYGREHCFAIPFIDESFAIAPAFRPEVNLQLHNARMCSLAREAVRERYILRQDMDRNIIVAHYVVGQQYGDPTMAFWAMDQTQGSYELPLDFFMDDPKVEDFVEATRLMYHFSGESEIKCCTEVLVDDTIFTFEEDATNHSWVLTPSRANTVVGLNTAPYPGRSVPQASVRLGSISKYDNGPLTYLVEGATSSEQYAQPRSMRCVSDLTNFTTISVGELDTLNEACTLSIFLPTPPKG